MAARKHASAAKVLAAVAQAAGRGRGRRSPLYLWFREHHDVLAAGFKRTPPAWQVLADALAEQGIRDADGKPPAAATARAAWWRVRRDLKAQAKAAAPSPPHAPEPGAIAPGVRPLTARPASAPPPSPSARGGSTPLPELPPLTDDRPRMPRPKFRNPK